MKKDDLPKIVSVFPLSNFIIFPKTTVPLNIFEPRYIDMINDSVASSIHQLQMMHPNKLLVPLAMLEPIGPKHEG